MSLYWPEQKVAIEIVDDPLAQPFDRAAHPDVRVLQVTCDQLDDWLGCMAFMDEICDALGQPKPPKTAQWLAANHRLHNALTRDIPPYWK